MHSPTFKQTCDKSHSCLQWHFKDCSNCNFPDGLQDTRTRLYHLFLLFLFRHVLLVLSFFFSHSRFSLSSLVHFPVGILSSVESVCREGRREGRREQGQSLTRELPPPPFAVRVCTTSVSCLLLSLSPSPFFHPSVREGLREGWTAGGREGLPRPPTTPLAPPFSPLSPLSPLPSPLPSPLSPLLSPLPPPPPPLSLFLAFHASMHPSLPLFKPHFPVSFSFSMGRTDSEIPVCCQLYRIKSNFALPKAELLGAY